MTGLLEKTVDYLKRVLTWFLDLVFPIQCVGCGTLAITNPYLCRSCFSGITIRQSSECIGCKAPFALGDTCAFCCDTSAVDRLLIAAPYDQPIIQKMLSAWKYRFIESLDIPFHALTKKYLHQMHNRRRLNIFHDDPVIISVPLSRRRRNFRGFNQAELLAQRLSTTFHISLDTTTLVRIRHTTAQVEVADRESRLANLAGAFECKDTVPIKGRSIILIDDVCTTGATLNECAKVLKAAGAERVTALVIARG